MTTGDMRHAQLHHVNFFTTRLDEMIDWYGQVLGMEVVFRFPLGAWITNDSANHRIALTAPPSLELDPDKRMHARLHHIAFEYASFDDLNATYLRLCDSGIVPPACLDHGMTLSYYYADPDDNYVELQCDVFGDWAASRAWMEESPAFRENPIGAFVDPGRVAAARAEGVVFDEIRRRIWETDDFRPDELPDLGGPPPRPGDQPMPVKW
jgi:catechol 2,3-dioxygenase